MEILNLRADYSDLNKFALAKSLLAGEAASWFHHQHSLLPFATWEQLKKDMMLRFGKRDDPERIALFLELA
ncbi:hypothetical protein EUTSA_v10015554mg, partial [Eutrema salsugineum]